MASNVFYSEPTTGRIFATDDVAGIEYLKGKIDIGPPGQSIPLTGTVQFGALVDVSRIQGTVGVTQSTTPWIVSGSVVLGSIPTVNQGTSPWVVSGGVDIGAPLPTGTNSIGAVTNTVLTDVWDSVNHQLKTTATLQVSGGVTIGSVGQGVGNGGTSPWSVSGSVTQGTSPWIVSGGVSIGSPLPAGTNTIGSVTQGTTPWVTSGGVTVSNFPSTQTINGTVTTLGNGVRIKGTSVVSGAYLTGNLLGSKIVLSGATRISGGQGVIETVVVADNKLSTGVSLYVVFFETNPVSTTFTDRSAFAPASGDLFNIIGHVSVSSSDYLNFSSNCEATKNGLGLEFNSSDTNLYYALISNDSPTYSVSSSLQVTVTIIQIS